MRYHLIDLPMTRFVPVAQWKTTSSANNEKSVQIFIYAKKNPHTITKLNDKIEI